MSNVIIFLWTECMQIGRFWMGDILRRGEEEDILWNMRLCGAVNSSRRGVWLKRGLVVHWGAGIWAGCWKGTVLPHESEGNEEQNNECN
jgi:hypothetical protein